MSGQLKHLLVWSRSSTPSQKCCRLPPTYYWTTWHQTRAFLIAVNNEKWFSGWFDNSEKGDVSGHLEHLWGWYRGCTPPQEHCQLPPTYFWTTWHQTRAFLISMKNENLINGWIDNTEKEDVSWQLERLWGWSLGCTPPQKCCRLPPSYFWTTWHQTRALWISMKNEKRFSGWLDNSEKGDLFGHCERLQGWSCGFTPPQEDCRLPLT
jgi:hypothetical protein